MKDVSSVSILSKARQECPRPFLFLALGTFSFLLGGRVVVPLLLFRVKVTRTRSLGRESAWVGPVSGVDTHTVLGVQGPSR